MDWPYDFLKSQKRRIIGGSKNRKNHSFFFNSRFFQNKNSSKFVQFMRKCSKRFLDKRFFGAKEFIEGEFLSKEL